MILLEAGKSDEQFLVKKPGMIGPMHSVPEIKKKVDWGFYTTPQEHALNRKIPQTRGKVVGGSSSASAMRASPIAQALLRVALEAALEQPPHARAACRRAARSTRARACSTAARMSETVSPANARRPVSIS